MKHKSRDYEGEWEDVRDWVPFGWTTQHLGSERRWFKMPKMLSQLRGVIWRPIFPLPSLPESRLHLTERSAIALCYAEGEAYSELIAIQKICDELYLVIANQDRNALNQSIKLKR